MSSLLLSLFVSTSILTAALPTNLFAGFAAPVDSSIILSSGEKVKGRLSGNEFFHWFESKDGRFFMLDKSGKTYVPYIPTTNVGSAGNGAISPKPSPANIKKELQQKFIDSNKANSATLTGVAH